MDVINVFIGSVGQPASTYKTKFVKPGIPFASQIADANTKYVIKHDFDMEGDSVEIPAGCLIEFDGGSLSNGTLVGNDTVLIYSLEEEDILHDMTLEGTFTRSGGNNIVVDDESLTTVDGVTKVKDNGIEGKHLNGNVVDNETLALDNNVIKLKNRANTDGMGKVTLGKNIVEGVNTLTQEMLPSADTIYVIGYEYVLADDITIPSNCILLFDGGSISGDYTITGSNTIVEYDTPIFEGVDFAGTWNIPFIYDWMLKDVTEENRIRVLFKLQNPDIFNTFYIENSDTPYVIVPSGDTESKNPRDGIDIYGNTVINNKATFKIKPNAQHGYTTFNFRGNGITFKGGTLIGDKQEHEYHESGSYYTDEWGYGIFMFVGCSNIIVDGVEIYDNIGNGIGINGFGVVVRNVKIHTCRRAGIAIFNVRGCLVENFDIYDCWGISPYSGILIEPNSGETHDVKITNGSVYSTVTSSGMSKGIAAYQNADSQFSGIYVSDVYIANLTRPIHLDSIIGSEVEIRNITIDNDRDNTSDNKGIIVNGCNNVHFENIKSVTTVGNDGIFIDKNCENIVVRDCVFESSNGTGEAVRAYNGTFINCKVKGYPVCFVQLDSAVDNSDTVHAVQCEFNGKITANSNMVFDECHFTDANCDRYSYLLVLRNTTKVELNNCHVKMNNCYLANLDFGTNNSSSLKIDGCEVDNTGMDQFYSFIKTNEHSTLVFTKNYGYKERDGVIGLAGNIILDKGPTTGRPTGLVPTDEGMRYYDTDLEKTVVASFQKGDIAISVPSIAASVVYPFVNTLTEGKVYAYVTTGNSGNIFDLYISKNNNAEITVESLESGDDVRLFMAYQKYRNAWFIAPDPAVYPYLKVRNRGTSGSTTASTIVEYNLVWHDEDGFIANPKSGTTAERDALTNVSEGYQFYDTTLSKPMWRNGFTWIDAGGSGGEIVVPAAIKTKTIQLLQNFSSVDIIIPTDGTTTFDYLSHLVYEAYEQYNHNVSPHGLPLLYVLDNFPSLLSYYGNESNTTAAFDAMAGWVVATLLTEIKPSERNDIMQIGYNIGPNKSTFIYRYDFHSDQNIARLVASAICAAMKGKVQPNMTTMRTECGGALIGININTVANGAYANYKNTYYISLRTFMPVAPGPYVSGYTDRSSVGGYPYDAYDLSDHNLQKDLDIYNLVVSDYNLGGANNQAVVQAISDNENDVHHLFGDNRTVDSYSWHPVFGVDTISKRIADNGATAIAVADICKVGTVARKPLQDNNYYGRKRPGETDEALTDASKDGISKAAPYGILINYAIDNADGNPSGYDREGDYNTHAYGNVYANSYPSGHSSGIWSTALFLMELMPTKADKIMKAANQYCVSRQINRYHWNSDTIIGRVVGALMSPVIRASDDYATFLANARTEIGE